MEIRERVKKVIEERTPQMLRLLEALVNTDSGTHDRDGVKIVCSLLEERLAPHGFSIERFPQERFGDHMVATLRGDRYSRGGKRVLIVGHMDTVFEKGEALRRPYNVVGDAAKGPGVHDMKSGLVSAVESCISLAECGFKDFGSITILFNSDEEVGSPTSRDLIESAARSSDCAFVLECAYPDGTVVTSRKGVGMYRLVTHGVAAHAGADPEKGASAILEMAHKIVEIHQLTDFDTGTTLNVGVVKGGTRRNVIAERAEAEIDLRVATAKEAERVERELRAIAGRTYVPGTRCELSGGLNRPPMERTGQVAELYELVRREAERLGLRIGERSTGGASDGNFIGHVGIPVVDGMGPQGGFAHSLDEYMQLSTFSLWVTLLAYSILASCGV